MNRPRKSQLFLNSILPVTRSHDEVISDKLKPGKFVITATGIVKALGLIILLAGITFFLSSRMCIESDSWHLMVFSISNTITLVLALCLYLIFSFGMTTNNPAFWVKADIISNITFPLLAIILSIVASSSCSKSSQLHSIPLPLVITGNVVMLFSTATLFMLYRYREEDNFGEVNLPDAAAPKKGRLSIFA